LQLARQEGAVQIITSKCSEVNVTVVPSSSEADPQETPIPEQFVSTFRDGKLVTEPATHSGA
jgi:adenylyl cyclase-associated protein